MARFRCFFFRHSLMIFIILYITRFCVCVATSSNHVIKKRDEAFECFNCSEESTELCQTKGNITACGKGTNTCFTQIRYHGGTYKVKKIVKSCILRPSCEEKMAQSTNEKCQQKENDFDCTTCCYKELCNKDAGTLKITSNQILTTSMVVFTIIFHFHVLR
ncbi:uncharacterized protein [Antedon mediterranea]|uniref:uncharacterized protein n=1 Tax=Antedon mediterranea TaxID=105859 RepID=UPI003AF9EA3B